MAHAGVAHIDLIGEEMSGQDVTDSFTLWAEMDGSSALDNPAVARLIRTVVSRFQRAGAVVNPSGRLHRYAALFDTDRA